MMKSKLKLGMIGGGQGSFIGKVHHMAAILDDQIELVCGVFSRDNEKNLASAQDYFVDSKRCYATVEEMVQKEQALPEGERMDLVAIVTPNNMHFQQAKLALLHGFHVVCDKPLTMNLPQAIELQQLVEKTKLVFAVTHAYTGYPMVKEAKEIIRKGRIGNIRKILVEYPQGWLHEKIEDSGQKQASWRTEPEIAGKSCTMGDIGVHAINISEYITGLKVQTLLAEMNVFVKGRLLDDDGSAFLRFEKGARGILTASQICAGEENALKIQVYGDKGGLEWHQMEPNSLIVKWPDKPTEIWRTGSTYLSEAASAHTRLPSGHPEGLIEAFANLYRNVAYAIKAKKRGENPQPLYDFPGIEDGVRGMQFIEAMVRSSDSGSKWVDL